jgi:FkbM family methyltransferase
MIINKGNLYKIVYNITPPFVFSFLKKSAAYPKLQALADKHLKKDSLAPSWNVITDGLLKGRKMFIDASEIAPWKNMINGEYDQFFVEFLKKLDLKGKTIYDIGAHFGYTSMFFAELVGPSGKVIAFEPNIYNKKRFEQNLSENKDFTGIIEIRDCAISDKTGEEDFLFNDNVDNGTSSGSFLDSSDTFYEKDTYEKHRGFKRVKIKTIPIDSLESIGITKSPFIMKIDIEGAEYLALKGAKQTLAKYRPILLIEIHSIFNMLKVGEILSEFGYKIELLKEETDGRCFISAI